MTRTLKWGEHRHDWQRQGGRYVCRKCEEVRPLGMILPLVGCNVREAEFQERGRDE